MLTVFSLVGITVSKALLRDMQFKIRADHTELLLNSTTTSQSTKGSGLFLEGNNLSNAPFHNSERVFVKVHENSRE